jgi:hypothetical protein
VQPAQAFAARMLLPEQQLCKMKKIVTSRMKSSLAEKDRH